MSKYKGLRIDYQPNDKVKVRLGRDWFDAEVVRSNKKTVLVRTLFSKTKYRKVQVKPEEANTATLPQVMLEPYIVSGTKIVKLPRIRVKPIHEEVPFEEIAERVSGVFTEHGKEMVAEVIELEEPPLVEYLEDTEPEDPDEKPPMKELLERATENAVDLDKKIPRLIKTVEDSIKPEPESVDDVLAELEKLLS